MNYNEVISNVNVYGIEEAIKGAKYSMAVDTNKCTDVLTNGIKALALTPIGAGEDNWMNGILVQFDLTCTIKMWVEAERYKFLNFIASQSTMHRAARFDIEKQCIGFVSPVIIEEVNRLKAAYLAAPNGENFLALVYNIPTGFRLTAKMTTNYRALKTIYRQRRNHRLPEWKAFCEWIESLPYSELITGERND